MRKRVNRNLQRHQMKRVECFSHPYCPPWASRFLLVFACDAFLWMDAWGFLASDAWFSISVSCFSLHTLFGNKYLMPCLSILPVGFVTLTHHIISPRYALRGESPANPDYRYFGHFPRIAGACRCSLASSPRDEFPAYLHCVAEVYEHPTEDLQAAELTLVASIPNRDCNSRSSTAGIPSQTPTNTCFDSTSALFRCHCLHVTCFGTFRLGARVRNPSLVKKNSGND